MENMSASDYMSQPKVHDYLVRNLFAPTREIVKVLRLFNENISEFDIQQWVTDYTNNADDNDRTGRVLFPYETLSIRNRVAIYSLSRSAPDGRTVSDVGLRSIEKVTKRGTLTRSRLARILEDSESRKNTPPWNIYDDIRALGTLVPLNDADARRRRDLERMLRQDPSLVTAKTEPDNECDTEPDTEPDAEPDTEGCAEQDQSDTPEVSLSIPGGFGKAHIYPGDGSARYVLEMESRNIAMTGDQLESFMDRLELLTELYKGGRLEP